MIEWSGSTVDRSSSGYSSMATRISNILMVSAEKKKAQPNICSLVVFYKLKPDIVHTKIIRLDHVKFSMNPIILVAFWPTAHGLRNYWRSLVLTFLKYWLRFLVNTGIMEICQIEFFLFTGKETKKVSRLAFITQDFSIALLSPIEVHPDVSCRDTRSN